MKIRKLICVHMHKHFHPHSLPILIKLNQTKALKTVYYSFNINLSHKKKIIMVAIKLKQIYLFYLTTVPVNERGVG